MGCLDDHTHPAGPDDLLDGHGDLGGELLLDLQPARVHVHDAGDLRKTDHLAVRQVGHVRLADEGQHVVLAERVELDILDDHHLVVFRGKYRLVHDLFQGLPVTLGQELNRLRCPLRRLEQPLARHVLAHPVDDLVITVGYGMRILFTHPLALDSFCLAGSIAYSGRCTRIPQGNGGQIHRPTQHRGTCLPTCRTE